MANNKNIRKEIVFHDETGDMITSVFCGFNPLPAECPFVSHYNCRCLTDNSVVKDVFVTNYKFNRKDSASNIGVYEWIKGVCAKCNADKVK